MQTCVPVEEPTVGGQGCRAPLSRLFLEVISDCNLQRVGFPGLEGKRRCSALPTHGTHDAPESGLTQTEESGNFYPASREKTHKHSSKTREHGPLLEETSHPILLPILGHVI